MNNLSISFLTIFLLHILSNFYSKGITITSKIENGVTTYYYNGQAFNTEEEVNEQIEKDYPGVVFYSNEPGFDIVSKYKGNNSFSNPIFDRIWEGYNYEEDSKNDFKDMRRRFVKETNEYRKAHGAPRLKRSKKLRRKAQKYAEYIASIEELVHDPRNKAERMGENLGVGSINLGHLAVKRWYDEVELYDFNKPKYVKGVGHFTALVWKSTTKLGFGVVENNGDVYVVCKYSPPGNVEEEFKENVLRRTD